MSYIVVVNPSILSSDGTGMPFAGVLTATVLVSFIATILMGLIAKLPFALAPGMGLNAFFTYTLILGEQIPWQTALGMVFWSGAFFTVISITPLREMIVKAIPHHLRLAMACGIGLFLTVIGLKNALLIEASPATLVTSASMSAELGFALIGLFVMIYFLRKKNPASFLIGILLVFILAVSFGKAALPDAYFSMPDFRSVFFELDLWGGLKWAYIPSVFTLVITDLFDSVSTFIGVSESSGMLDKNGEPKNMKKALFVDALATMFSGVFGTSPVTTYIESSAGCEVGGRGGITAVSCALCFLPCLFLSPLIAAVPSYATAPVLLLVGAMMFRSVAKIDFSKWEKSVPAFLTMILIPMTFSITQGLLWGFLSHVVLFLMSGRSKELSPMMYLLAIISVMLIFSG